MIPLLGWLFRPIFDSLNRIEDSLSQLHEKADLTMGAVQIQQEDLDQFATDIQDSVDAVAAELQKLVDDTDNPLTEADVTALQAAIDNLKALEPPQVDNTLPEPEEPTE